MSIRTTASSARLSRLEGRELFNCKSPKGAGKYTVAPKEYRMIDGIQFDSMAEVIRYGQLTVKSLIGEVVGLKYHHVFECVVNGVRICKYEVDFTYLDGNGVRHFEEVKSGTSRKERDWNIRRTLAQALFGVEIEVVKI